MMATIICPVSVLLPRKTKSPRKINLNQNTIHNVNRRDYDKAKKEFHQIILPQLSSIVEEYDKVHLIFTYYHGRKILGDLSNHCVIIDKFLSDSLVQAWIIPADDYSVIKYVTYIYGGYDKNKDRVEVQILPFITSPE